MPFAKRFGPKLQLNWEIMVQNVCFKKIISNFVWGTLNFECVFLITRLLAAFNFKVIKISKHHLQLILVKALQPLTINFKTHVNFFCHDVSLHSYFSAAIFEEDRYKIYQLKQLKLFEIC